MINKLRPLSIAAAILLIGCQSSQTEILQQNLPVQDTTAAHITASQDDPVTDFQRFKDIANGEISDNVRELIRLKTKMVYGREAYEKYNLATEVLQKRNDSLKVKVNAYKDDTKAAQETFKARFNNDMDSLNKDIKTIGE